MKKVYINPQTDNNIGVHFELIICASPIPAPDDADEYAAPARKLYV